MDRGRIKKRIIKRRKRSLGSLLRQHQGKISIQITWIMISRTWWEIVMKVLWSTLNYLKCRKKSHNMLLRLLLNLMMELMWKLIREGKSVKERKNQRKNPFCNEDKAKQEASKALSNKLSLRRLHRRERLLRIESLRINIGHHQQLSLPAWSRKLENHLKEGRNLHLRLDLSREQVF